MEAKNETILRMPKVVVSTAPEPLDGREAEAAGGHQFAAIPLWMIRAPISDRAKILWSYLRVRAGDDGFSWHSRRAVAKYLNLEPRQIQYDMTQLRKIGAVFSVPWVNDKSERVADCVVVWPKSVADFTEDDLRKLRGYGHLPTRESLPVEVRYVEIDDDTDDSPASSPVSPLRTIGRGQGDLNDHREGTVMGHRDVA
jgi:hypothetical protein